MLISFQLVRTRIRIDGFNCHHLVPRQVIESREFARFFGNLRSEGFDPEDFLTNGMHLPSTEKLAVAFSLPMHRGPHPQYNEMVASHIRAIEPLSPKDALHEIIYLQKVCVGLCVLWVQAKFWSAAVRWRRIFPLNSTALEN